MFVEGEGDTQGACDDVTVHSVSRHLQIETDTETNGLPLLWAVRLFSKRLKFSKCYQIKF